MNTCLNLTPKQEECKHEYQKLAYLVKASDMIIQNGEWRMKRKYGKFTRQAIKISVDAPV